MGNSNSSEDIGKPADSVGYVDYESGSVEGPPTLSTNNVEPLMHSWGSMKSIKDPKVGYRVLSVQQHSPGSFSGLVAYFDFIIAANGVPLRTLDTTFISLIKASEEKPITLSIYNLKSQSLRDVVLVPSRRWPGEGMLGITIRFDSFEEAEDQVIHVLEIEPNSPADLAGLIPNADYLLGTAEKAFSDPDILFQELSSNLERPIEFYVYNSVTDEVRIIVLMPSSEWGGVGILGASVGHGYLHRLPIACCNTLGRPCIALDGALKAVNSPFGVHEYSPDIASSAAELQGALSNQNVGEGIPSH